MHTSTVVNIQQKILTMWVVNVPFHILPTFVMNGIIQLGLSP